VRNITFTAESQSELRGGSLRIHSSHRAPAPHASLSVAASLIAHSPCSSSHTPTVSTLTSMQYRNLRSGRYESPRYRIGFSKLSTIFIVCI
jgi:hypothetical protein